MIVIVGSNERLWCVCVCVMFKRLLDTQEKWGGEGHADSEKEHSREGKSGQRCKKYESLVEEGETTERQGKALGAAITGSGLMPKAMRRT